MAAALAVATGGGPAGAALQSGDYICLGASGILVGMGFRVSADGNYTDLDNKSSGSVTYSADGGTVTFVGGHLAGQVGRGAQGGRSLRINNINCQRS
jgi:hypothetical protein